MPGSHFVRLASFPTPVDGYPLAIIRRRRVDQILKRFQPELVSVHTIGPTGMLGFSLARQHRAPVLFSWHTDIESYSRTYRIARILAVNSYLSLSLDRCLETADARAANNEAVGPEVDDPEAADLETVATAVPASGASSAVWVTAVRPPDVGPNPCGTGVISASLRQASQRMSAVCAPSSGAAAQVRRFGVRRPVFVMPTDVMPAHLGVGTAAACRAVRLVPGLGVTPYLLYVGRLSREKNLELLLQAFSQIEPGDAEVIAPSRLVLVGPAKDARTRALLRRHGVRPGLGRAGSDISDRIVVLGPLPRHQLGEIYRRSAAFVTTSRSETQCLSVSEAIALGTRVIVVDPQLAVDRTAGAVLVTAPEPSALAAAMGDALRRARQPTPSASTILSASIAASASTTASAQAAPSSPPESGAPMARDRVEPTESLAVRLVAAAECARSAPRDAVLRWERDHWVGGGPGSYG